MKTATTVSTKWETIVHQLGRDFADRATEHDKSGAFVTENYRQLREHRLFSALIPEELGGGGISYPEMCHLIRILAHYCGSTALAFSMHQHLIAASVWKYRHKGAGAQLLQRVSEQQLVLVSTGARDWLQSNGELQQTEGGYLFSAKKHFASQSAIGDIAITSAPFQHPDGSWQVLHFPVPLDAVGVTVANDWDVLGMRATGSHTIIFENVFVPETTIALARPRAGFHPVWNVVLTVAMPLIMSAYLGIAERAMEIAVGIGKKYHRNQQHLPYIIGKLNNTLLSAQAQWKSMISLTNNFDFQPDEGITMQILSYKTNVANAVMSTVSQAMEAIGGQSFYRKNELERLFRDVQGARFHPLPEWDQYVFCGERLLERM